MPRNMIEANKVVFSLLDEYADQQGEPLKNAGEPRWISTSPDDKVILKDFNLEKALRVSETRVIQVFQRAPDTIFTLIGFDKSVFSQWFIPVEVGPGLLTAILSEARPKPIASGISVRQIVEAQDRRDKGYEGHSSSDIASLFPTSRAFLGYDFSIDQFANVVLDFVLSEAVASDNWIGEGVSQSLRQLLELDLIDIPYLTLARSMLDHDRSSLFMALYRCFEALYAHAGAVRVKRAFGLQERWNDVAVELETALNWRPIEWQSLEALMKMAAPADLAVIRDAIAPAFDGTPSSDVVRAASDLLYRLRNSVVHYRAVHRSVDHEKVDWDSLCCACATAVAYIYSEIFDSI